MSNDASQPSLATAGQNPAAEFWWKYTTGPHAFLAACAELADLERSAILAIPGDLPWRQEMRHTAYETIRHLHPGIIVEPIDAEADLAGADETAIGRYFLAAYADSAVARSYRSRSKRSIEEYLVQNKVLARRIVWVRGVGAKDRPAWLTFVRNFAQHSPGLESGLVLLEWKDQRVPQPAAGLNVLRFGTYIGSHDVQCFNEYRLAERRSSLDRATQRYAALVAAMLCVYDAQVADALLSECAWESEDPLVALDRVAAKPEFARRGTEDPTHVLSLLRIGNREALMLRLWDAQVQELFPLIEKKHIAIVDQHRREISIALNYARLTQYNQLIMDPDDVEPGTLVALLASGNLTLNSADTIDTIHLLRDCRNRIAHKHGICTPQEVNALLRLS